MYVDYRQQLERIVPHMIWRDYYLVVEPLHDGQNTIVPCYKVMSTPLAHPYLWPSYPRIVQQPMAHDDGDGHGSVHVNIRRQKLRFIIRC